MRTFTAVVERCSDTGLFVGYVPGFPGAHSQGETLDELNRNLSEVIEMLLEDGEAEVESRFVGTQTIEVDRPCRSCRCSSRTKWSRASRNWDSSKFDRVVPTSNFVIPMAGARPSPSTKGGISHRIVAADRPRHRLIGRGVGQCERVVLTRDPFSRCDKHTR